MLTEVTETPIAKSFDELVDRQLVKYEEVIPAVEELKKEYLSLTIASLDDKEGYEKVSKGLRLMVRKRNEIDEKRKELKADAIRYGTLVDDKAKEYTALIAPIEAHLRSEKEKIDGEKKRIEEEKELAKQKKIAQRHQQLLDAGMYILNESYFWQSKIDPTQDEMLHRLNLETYDDEKFELYRANVERLVNAEKETLRAEEEKRRQAQKKIDDEKKALEDEQRLMKQERLNFRSEILEILGFVRNENSFTHSLNVAISIDEIETFNSTDWQAKLTTVKSDIEHKKQEAAHKEKINSRYTQLTTLGLRYSSEYDAFVSGSVNVDNKTEICLLDDAQWTYLINKVTNAIEEEKKAEIKRQQEAEALLKKQNDRRAELTSLGLFYNFQSQIFTFETINVDNKTQVELLNDEEWALLVTKVKKEIESAKERIAELKKQKEIEEEKERLENLSEKQRFSEYLSKLIEVPTPEFKTAKWKQQLNNLQSAINQFK